MNQADQFTIAGLTSSAARERFLQTGPNRIFTAQPVNFFKIAVHEVSEPMILLLIAVGFFYSLWGKLEDAVTIFIVIFLLVFAEVYNEYRAKKAISALQKISAPKAKVLRDGELTEIEAEAVVKGDLLLLSTGTEIAADAEVIRSIGLQCDEAALTGESLPQDKKEGDRVYAGTVVVSGEAKARVIATGRETRLGKVAEAMKTVKPPKTPLQLAMKSLVGKLVYIAAFFSIIIPVIGILRGFPVKTMILTGLSLSFATIPEELPIIITMVLGLGAYVLSKDNFLVKRLRGAETLGNATVIATDKTGTITEGIMKIVSIYPEQREKEIIKTATRSFSEYALSPLEARIKEKADLIGEDASHRPEAVRERELGKENKKTKSVIRKTGGDYTLFLSGAPEEVFGLCRDLENAVRERLKDETISGRRVVAVASRKLSPGEEKLPFPEIEKGMDFIGLIAFEDSPREGVKETVHTAANAGIRTLMVTGDHALTARFIARETGIPAETVLEGKELDSLDEEHLRSAVKSISVFARATPKHKYRIVQALQKNDEVVAVTGDGINDILALKAADIGIAMGIRGTDAAKDAAEVVLADDNYITITRGIFEGRKFFDNLQKGIAYYLSVKVALVMIFLLPVLAGLPMPFSPIQIILLELFMDLAASLGFVSEPKERNIYSRPPAGKNRQIITADLVTEIFIKAGALFLAVTLVFLYSRYHGMSFAQSQTFAFSAWMFGHIILAHVSRSRTESVLSLGVFTNKIINIWTVAAVVFLIIGIYLPFVRDRFNLAFISPAYLVSIAVFTSILIGLLEIKKAYRPV